MKRQNKFDKIFKIAVLGLLALILTFQISSMISFENNYPFGEEYIIDIGYGDFLISSEIFEQKSFHASYDIYTYEEFGTLINKSIKSNIDLINYAKENNYEFYEEESVFLFIDNIGEECSLDKIRNIELCLINSLAANEQNNQIIFSSNTAFEEMTIEAGFYEEIE